MREHNAVTRTSGQGRPSRQPLWVRRPVRYLVGNSNTSSLSTSRRQQSTIGGRPIRARSGVQSTWSDMPNSAPVTKKIPLGFGSRARMLQAVASPQTRVVRQ